MKPEYKDLKLIIECPTQDAWDTVTEFFGLKWNHSQKWVSSETAIRIGSLPNGAYEDYGCRGTGYTVMEPFYTHHTYLTYPEFEQQYLNKTDVIFTKEARTPELIDLSILDEEPANIVRNLYNGMREIKMQKEMAEVAKPKPTTVHDIVSRTNLSADMDKKVEAFKQLLACAEWANEQFKEEDGAWFVRYRGHTYNIPVKLNGVEAKEKFLSIDGIEELLNTFYGI